MQPRVTMVGGGAAGFFAAITCAELARNSAVTLLEKSPKFLSKVRISGGCRCNVTHACFEPRQLITYYPRGGPALAAPLQRFQPRDTIAWFESRGVKLKTEADGRIFPVTDSSQTIIDCLLTAARRAGVDLLANCNVERITASKGQFELVLGSGRTISCDRVMLAMGGCRAAIAAQLALSLGHTIEPPVPSLFAFHVAQPWVRELAGISLGSVEVSIPELRRRERGALLFTHSAVSGPVTLRLSAWGARELHALNYHFKIRLNCLPELDSQALVPHLESIRRRQPARLIVNSPISPLAARLWDSLVLASGISGRTRWADLSNAS